MIDNSERIYFDEIADILFAFEDFLRRNCLWEIESGSRIEDRALHIISMIYELKRAHDSGENLMPSSNYGEALGLLDLITKLYTVRHHPNFSATCPHLRMLATRVESASQLIESTTNDQVVSDKIIELYIASIVMRVCGNIDIEDPNISAGGTNPDVIADIHGQTWGIGIKTLYVNKPGTYFNAVRRAIEQIEVSRACRGLVIVNLKNTISSRELWPEGGQPNFESAFNQLLSNGQKTVEGIINISTSEDVTKLFLNKKSIPVILNYFGGTTEVIHNGRPRLTLLRAFHAYPVPNLSARSSDWDLLKQLNEYLHNR